MKKKIFTLFALGFLLSMVCGVVSAQKPVMVIEPTGDLIDSWGPTIGKVTEKIIGYYDDPIWNDMTAEELDVAAANRMVEGCSYKLTVNLPGRMVTSSATNPAGFLEYVKDSKVTIVYPSNVKLAAGYAKDFIIVPGKTDYSFTFTIAEFTSNSVGTFDLKVEGAGIYAGSTFDAAGLVWYDDGGITPLWAPKSIPYTRVATRPTFKVEYERPQTWFYGMLDNHIKGGTPDMLISIDEGYTWVDRYYEFTTEDIRDAMPPFWVKIPGSCGIFPLMYIDDLPYEVPGIVRAIVLPKVDGIEITYPLGQLHYVRSGSDFVFYVNPKGARFTVLTGRSSDNAGGVLYERQADGTWKITIKAVSSAINVEIVYGVGNETVAGSAVWAEGGQVFINSAVAGSANIFNATGALVRTVTFGAGETAGAALPAGIYVAVINGKAVKFVVK